MISSLTLATFPWHLFEMPNAIFTIGGIIAIIAIICGSMTSIVRTRARERTRRELAAYVAEGSIQPEQAVAMMRAGEEDDEE